MRGRLAGFRIAYALIALHLIAVMAPFVRLPPLGPEPAPRRGVPEPVIPLYDSENGEPVYLRIEDYVAGVVAAEMNPAFPVEALAAQAIIARTYTMRQLERGIEPVPDVERFQAYKPERVTGRISEAVRQTRGMVITYEGALADTYYHACAGGKTATAAEAFGSHDRPYLRMTAEAPCERADAWTADFSSGEVASAAGITGSVQSIGIGSKGPSGRTLTLTVNGVDVSARKLRAALGSTRMRSTMLRAVRLREGRVEMEGRGFGHGVGLSQWGAKAMADQGAAAERIIRHYYPGTHLEKWW